METELKEIKESLEETAKASRLMGDMVQVYDRQNKRLWIAVLSLLGALVIAAGCMVWAVKNAQTVANDAVLHALETVAEMEVVSETTTTTTTEVTQDTGEGDGNNVYLDGDSTTYNEGSPE